MTPHIIAEIINWTGNIGFMIGSIMLAKQIRKGWMFHLTGNICYFTSGLILSLYSLTVLSFVLGIVDIFGFKSWKTPPSS